MSLAYGIVCIVALVQLGLCIAIDRGKELCLLLLFVSAFICDLGYFLLSISKTLNQALMANRITYFGNVFLPLFMFLMILKLCSIHCPKWLLNTLFSVGMLLFGIAASPGYLTVYYKSVSIEIVDGVTNLIREYGPFHVLYYIYLFLYFGAMLSVICCSIAKKKKDSYIHSMLLLAAVLVNITVWLVEHFLPHGFEFLSVFYILSEDLILFLYGAFQKYNWKQRMICTWTAAFAGVGLALLCKVVQPGNPAYYFFSLIRSFIYIGIYYAWGRVVCYSIIQKTQRFCLWGISVLLVFWIAADACKHLIFPYDITIVRYLWYACYIPKILIAVLSLIIVVMVGKGENAKLGKWGLALLGGAAVLSLLVLTNDFHQLVFSFPGNSLWTNSACANGFGYYLIMAQITLCSVGALLLLVLKCRVPERKKYAGIPVLCLVFMLVYGHMHLVEGSVAAAFLNDMTAADCLLIAALFESLIESGLLQTNIGYGNLIQSSALAVQITDQEHRVRYATENIRPVSEAILAEADIAPVMLDRATRLSGTAIRGGQIYWQEDVSELLSVQEELELTQNELRDTGDVLKAESEQRAYMLHLEVKNQLYDLVETQTAPQITLLLELTTQLKKADDLSTAKHLLGKIVIIGTYIKRRSNLIFVAGQEKNISAAELFLCMNESAENLKLYGVDCKIKISGCERLSPEIANTVYDIFEAVIEQSIDTVSAIMLYMEPENGGFFLTICADCTDDLTVLCRSFPKLSAGQDEDGLWYLNMAFETGGAKL